MSHFNSTVSIENENLKEYDFEYRPVRNLKESYMGLRKILSGKNINITIPTKSYAT